MKSYRTGAACRDDTPSDIRAAINMRITPHSSPPHSLDGIGRLAEAGRPVSGDAGCAASPAFSGAVMARICSCLRRATPRPARPTPRSARVAGSGTMSATVTYVVNRSDVCDTPASSKKSSWRKISALPKSASSSPVPSVGRTCTEKVQLKPGASGGGGEEAQESIPIRPLEKIMAALSVKSPDQQHAPAFSLRWMLWIDSLETFVKKNKNSWLTGRQS